MCRNIGIKFLSVQSVEQSHILTYHHHALGFLHRPFGEVQGHHDVIFAIHVGRNVLIGAHVRVAHARMMPHLVLQAPCQVRQHDVVDLHRQHAKVMGLEQGPLGISAVQDGL